MIMSSEEALGLLRKWKSESTLMLAHLVFPQGIGTANLRGSLIEAGPSWLILSHDGIANLIINLAQASRFVYEDVREIPEEIKALAGGKLDSRMDIHASVMVVNLYILEAPIPKV